MRTAILVALVCAISSARDRIDWASISLPFIEGPYPTAPRQFEAMPLPAALSVQMKHGRHTFRWDPDCDGPFNRCPALMIERISTARLTGGARKDVVVAAGYHTGGVVSWQYIYVFRVGHAGPEVVAWFQTAEGEPIRSLAAQDGELLVDLASDGRPNGVVRRRFR